MKKGLSILPEVAMKLEAGILRKFAIIDGFDFNPVRKRMLADFPNYTENELDEMEAEVRKFLALALLEKKADHRIVVSEKIDTLWHYFILHTQQYRNFCKAVYGEYLNHVPILPEQKQELNVDYQKTRQVYAIYFGQPPVHLWGDDQQICWGGCDERVAKPEEELEAVN